VFSLLPSAPSMGNNEILNPIVTDPGAAVVVYISWPLAIVIQCLVLRMLFKAKMSFLNLRFVIPIHFLVEFLFTVTFIQLSVDDMGFRLTLALHGLTDCMFAFNMLFRRTDAQRLFPWAMCIWSFTTAASAVLYYPLDIVVGGSFFVVPMDVLTFLGSIAIIRRTTNQRAKLSAYFMLYHMISAFIIFGVYLSKSSFGYPLIINAVHVLICCVLWTPIAQLSDEELVSQGITPPLGLIDSSKSADSMADGTVALTVKSDDAASPKAAGDATPPTITATDILSPTRLEKPMHAFTLAGIIVSVFFGGLLIGIFVSYTTSFWDLIQSPIDYYHPGAYKAI